MSRVVLITGTSSGFGKLVVDLYLERGWTVVATLRGADKRGPQLFGEAGARAGGRLHLLELDIERPNDWAGATRYIDERLGGRLDVLVNNAGYGLMGAFEDQTLEQLRRQFEVNFFGLAGLTKALLPTLRRNRGRILNISSIVGIIGMPLSSAYNSTKHALEGFTEALYYELKPLGVQVGLVEPGGFKTDFVGRSLILAEGAKDPRSPYANMSRLLIKMNERGGITGADPIHVARKIVKLSECRRLPLRTLAGVDAHFMAFLRRILPHDLRVGLISILFNWLLKRSAKEVAVTPAGAD